jgi:hypothetical protein
MTEGTPPDRRTRRRRATTAQHTPAPSERALRDLAGATPSQVGVQGALRARDVNRPTPADLAEAERDVQIVRRNWRPA